MQYDKEDLALAAAFALGDPDVVQRVTQSFEKQKLGIGLKKFTAKSINHIIKVFGSFKGPDIDFKVLSLFIQVGVYSSDFREGYSEMGKPKLVMLNDKWSYSANLQHWGNEFGLHVMHSSWLRRGTHKSLLETRGKYTVDKSLHNDDDGNVILTNFCCKFETDIEIRVEEETLWTSTKYQNIACLAKKKAQQHRRSPSIDAIANIFAEKIASGVINAAMQRLTKLVLRRRRGQEISFEHISVYSGNSSNLLRMLRELDMNMILAHNDKIASTLQTTLKQSVPMPDNAVVKKGESPNALLNREITTFVNAYIKLVNLSYCEVPLLAGKPPSSFVPEYSVQAEARRDEDCLWEAHPIMILATRRLQEKEERERRMRSRDLVVPGKLYSFLFVALLWALSSWLCTVTTEKLLQFFHSMHSNLSLHAISQGFTLWAMHSLVGIFKTSFRLSEDCSYGSCVMLHRIYSSHYCHEAWKANSLRPRNGST